MRTRSNDGMQQGALRSKHDKKKNPEHNTRRAPTTHPQQLYELLHLCFFRIIPQHSLPRLQIGVFGLIAHYPIHGRPRVRHDGERERSEVWAKKKARAREMCDFSRGGRRNKVTRNKIHREDAGKKSVLFFSKFVPSTKKQKNTPALLSAASQHTPFARARPHRHRNCTSCRLVVTEVETGQTFTRVGEQPFPPPPNLDYFHL